VAAVEVVDVGIEIVRLGRDIEAGRPGDDRPGKIGKLLLDDLLDLSARGTDTLSQSCEGYGPCLATA
jgi:hypothetical protein